MENENKKIHYAVFIGKSFLLLLFLLAIIYCAYKYSLINLELEATRHDLKTTESFANKRALALRQNIDTLKVALGQKKSENENLSLTLNAEQEKNNLFETQIQAIGGTVGKLTKLSQTDKELLQKYSNVYFLNEHYIPENLSVVHSQYLFDKKKTLQFHTSAYPFLARMFEDASSTNPLLIVSAYRSFGEQASLKNNYLVTYGTGANKFSADQGYSEHQLGTTLDLTTPKLGSGFTKFDSSSAYEWLTENAYKYGFVLSYPKGNKYFQYEPWHWRFVGVDLANKLHSSSEYFYDVPQREIDSYLVSIF